MKRTMLTALLLVLSRGGIWAAEITTFPAYVDSDLCAHLMLGPINSARVDCSQRTFKEGSDAVLVRLSNSMIFEINKPKMVHELVGQVAQVSGQANVNSGEIKLTAAQALDVQAIPVGDAARKPLDVRTYRLPNAPKVYEKIRHELAMMPYISDFDFISFAMVGGDVILNGWTVRPSNRSDAENTVKRIEGVENIVNNIDVLPASFLDQQIRARARGSLQQILGRYFWASGSDIKIVVKNGDIILLGTVSRQADSDIANVQCNSLPGVFKVFNMLRVAGTTNGKKG